MDDFDGPVPMGQSSADDELLREEEEREELRGWLKGHGKCSSSDVEAIMGHGFFSLNHLRDEASELDAVLIGLGVRELQRKSIMKHLCPEEKVKKSGKRGYEECVDESDKKVKAESLTSPDENVTRPTEPRFEVGKNVVLKTESGQENGWIVESVLERDQHWLYNLRRANPRHVEASSLRKKVNGGDFVKVEVNEVIEKGSAVQYVKDGKRYWQPWRALERIQNLFII